MEPTEGKGREGKGREGKVPDFIGRMINLSNGMPLGVYGKERFKAWGAEQTSKPDFRGKKRNLHQHFPLSRSSEKKEEEFLLLAKLSPFHTFLSNSIPPHREILNATWSATALSPLGPKETPDPKRCSPSSPLS